MIGGTIVALQTFLPGPTPSSSPPPASGRPSTSANPVPPAPAGLTFADFSVDPKAVPAPTSSSAQSKVWYAEGSWWGVLFSPTTHRLGIYRLDAETQVWADTGALVDERTVVDADVLWTGTHLYIVAGGSRDSEAHAIRLRRFSYDAGEARFVLDPDFPVTVRSTGASPAVLAADSTGMIWMTYVAAGRVWLSHTLGEDTTWSAPLALRGPEATVDLSDVASLVAFGPGRLGVMWTNLRSGVWFSAHDDGAADDVWSAPEPILTDERSDDTLSLAEIPLADGRTGVAAALSTLADEGSGVRGLDPLTLLATRDDQGGWDTALVGLVRDRHARPIVLVDPAARTIAVAATSPGNGGAIYYKRTPLDRIEFDTGLGVPLIASTTELTIDRVSASKGPLSVEAGLLVLATDRTSGRYLHGIVDLGAGPPAADPADPDRPDRPSPPPDGTTTTLLRDAFESWTYGRNPPTGWSVRPGDPKDSLAIVSDGGGGNALRVPSAPAGVRACRDVPEIEGAVLTVRARVRLSRVGQSDALMLSVRGSGGEAASIRVTDLGVWAWFDGTVKVRPGTTVQPRTWYRITVRVDQAERTWDMQVTTDSGRPVVGASGLRWRAPEVTSVRSVCLETAGAAPAQVIDLGEVTVLQDVAP